MVVHTLNTAGFNDAVDVFHLVSGKVLVYLSNEDLANLSIQNIRPSAFIKLNVTPSIEPVLTKVAEKFSPT